MADSLRPAIVTRAQWGADESIRRPIDYNTTIKAIVVHHTVNANDYTRAQVPAIIRSIYAYHVKGRGWSDVGYNFLVDRFGTVYEGRKGSIDKLARGVHTGGFNTYTMGIAAIGNYGTVAPSAALLNSIAQVAAWKLAPFGRDPLGTTTLTAGIGSTRQPPGWTGPVSVISGHRDLAATACPGQLLYNQLPTIRAKVAALLVPITAVTAVEAAPPGSPVIATTYAATGTVTWSATIRATCSNTVVRTLSGSGTRLAQIVWDGLTTAGTEAPPGIYRLDITRTVGGVTYADRTLVVERLPDGSAPTGMCGLYRLGGADRSATAVALGRQAFPTGSEVVIVAADQASAVDGLVAAPFAHARSAPVLLADKDALPAATQAEITRRHATTAWVVGGTGVVSDQVVSALHTLGVTTVTRLSGSNRIGTANAVAARMGTPDGVLLASGENSHLIDAASAGGAAAALGRPIMLVVGDALTADTRSVLAAMHPSVAAVIGGTGAVSDAAEADLAAATGVSVVRLGGADRLGTSLAVADGFVGAVGADTVLVASAQDSHLIDSLTGGVLGWLTLLVPGDTSSPAAEAWISSHGTTHVGIAGGPGAVSTPAAADLLGAL